MIQSDQPRHVLLAPFLLRSHLRILLQLASNLFSICPNLVASMLITRFMAKMFQQEIDLLSSEAQVRFATRVRVEILEDGLEEGVPTIEEKLAFRRLCVDVLREKLKKPEHPDAWPAVSSVVTDMFRVHLRKQVQDICTDLGIHPIPVYHLMPTMALALHRTINTTENGGAAENMLIRYNDYLSKGMNEPEAAMKAYRFLQDRLFEWPDLPPMYDHEFTPQAACQNITKGSSIVQSLFFKVSRNTDGIICSSVPELDAASLAKIASVMRVSTFAIGAQFDEKVWRKSEVPASRRGEDLEVLDFLDDALKEHGPNTALYISFGSLFWPTLRPEIVTTIIDSLLDLDPPMPFVFATASQKAYISQELRDRVRDSGRGLISTWVPQLEVLQHPATGLFLTHCGWGSLTEAIICGVPIVTIPFSMDQPALSAHFTQIQKIGIQLHQMTSGSDGLPLGAQDDVTIHSTPKYMRRELDDTWRRMRGAEGDVCRKRIIEVGYTMRDSWEQGETRKGIVELGKTLMIG